MSENGFIKLPRAYFQHPFWTKRRVFDEAAAWLDLIQRANWRDGRVFVNGRFHEVPRGCLIGSVRYFETAWKWSAATVQRYLKMLEAEQMITREVKQGFTLIRVCLFDTFNSFGGESETLDGTRNETRVKHRDAKERNTYKHIDEHEKEEEKNIRREEGTEVLAATAANASPADEAAKPPRRKSQLADAEFLAALKANPAYAGVDVDRELGKMQAWLLTPKGRGRQLTRGFIVNWLNRVDVKVDAPAAESLHQKKHPIYGV